MNPRVPTLLREWAALTRALVDGRIAVLLRAGGLHEPDGAGRFRLDRREFGLLPTTLHQRPEHVAEGFGPVRFDEAQVAVDVEAVARARQVFRVEDEGRVAALAELSGHRPRYAMERFWFRAPGLLAVLVEVHRLDTPRRDDLGPEHAGCRSWLTIDPAQETEGARPVLPAGRLLELENELARRVEG